MRFKRYTAPHPARTALGLSLMAMSDDQRTIVENGLIWLAGNRPDPGSFREALDEYRLVLQCIGEEKR